MQYARTTRPINWTPVTRRKQLLLIGGAVLLGLVVVAGGLALFGWQIVQQAKTAPDHTPVTEADKRLLLTAADIVTRLGGPAVEPEAEHWSALRQGTHTRFILYRYEPKNETPIFIYSRLGVFPYPSRARRMYQMDKFMMKLGPGGESYVPAPGLFPEGGERNAWFIEKDGDKIGNFFLIREGRYLASAKLNGLTLHDPADVARLLGPMLDELRR